MARNFEASGTDQWLALTPAGGLPITAAPITVSLWVKAETTNAGCPWWMGDPSVTNEFWSGYSSWTASGYEVRASTSSSAGEASARTTNYVSAGVWQHWSLKFIASTSRSSMLAGDTGNKGTNATSRAPSGADTIAIGRANDSTPGVYFDGDVAEVAVWNIALTEAQEVALAGGVCPLLIAPGSLEHYIPLGGLFGDHDRDIITGETFTVNGSPTFSDHPGGLIYPATALSVPVTGGGAPPPGGVGRSRILGGGLIAA